MRFLTSVFRQLNCLSKLTCSKKVLMRSLLVKSGTKRRRLPESLSRGDVIQFMSAFVAISLAL